MTTLLSRRRLIGFALGTEGSFNDATMTAANANLKVIDPRIKYDTERAERNSVRQTIGRRASGRGKTLARITFGVELNGAGVAGDAPAIGRVLKACAFSETVEAGVAAVSAIINGKKNVGTSPNPAITGTFNGTKNGILRFTLTAKTLDTSAVLSWAFFPSDGSAASFGTTTHTDGDPETLFSGLSVEIDSPAVTNATVPWRLGDEWFFKLTSDQSEQVIYKTTTLATPADITVYQDGRLHKVHSCVGRVSGSFTVGEFMSLQFEFTGVPSAQVDAAMPTGVPFEDAIPPVFMGVSFTMHGDADRCFSKFDFDTGNTVSVRDCARADNGIAGVRIASREMTGSVDAEADLVANWNPFAKLMSAVADGVILIAGSDAGNTVTMEFPNAQIVDLEDEDREGIIVDRTSLAFVEPEEEDVDNGFSEMILTFS